MQRAGVNIIKNSDELTTFGFYEGLKNYPKLKRTYQEVISYLESNSPDIFLPISFGGFNLKLAKTLKKKGSKVIYMAPPQLWAWGRWRAKELKENSNKVICLFPFEERFFRDLGINAVYLGNPLLDYVEQERNSYQVLLDRVPDNTKIITFMPGSRKEEINNHLPLMLKIFNKLKDEIKNVHGFVVGEKKDFLPNINKLYYTREGKYKIMAKSDLIVLSSGTASLEAAILGIPHVAIYRLSLPSYLLARILVTTKRFALTNIILGEDGIPEFIQPTFQKLYPIIIKSLQNPDNKIREKLSKIKNILGQPRAAKRIAQEIVS